MADEWELKTQKAKTEIEKAWKSFKIKFGLIGIILLGASLATSYLKVHYEQEFENKKRLDIISQVQPASSYLEDVNNDGNLDIIVKNGERKEQVHYFVEGEYLSQEQIKEIYGNKGLEKYLSHSN